MYRKRRAGVQARIPAGHQQMGEEETQGKAADSQKVKSWSDSSNCVKGSEKAKERPSGDLGEGSLGCRHRSEASRGLGGEMFRQQQEMPRAKDHDRRSSKLGRCLTTL